MSDHKPVRKFFNLYLIPNNYFPVRSDIHPVCAIGYPRFMKKLTGTLSALILMACTSAYAEVRIEADHLIISGKLTNKDADDVVDAFQQHSIQKVIFRRSPGGEWRAGMRIGSLLAGKSVTTVAEDGCISACALAFLGGKYRLLGSSDQPGYLVFHPPYSPENQQTVITLKDAFLDWIEQRTQRPVPEKFRESVNQMTNAKATISFFQDTHFFAKKVGSTVLICKGTEQDPPFDCEKTAAFDGVSSGIVTAAP